MHHMRTMGAQMRISGTTSHSVAPPPISLHQPPPLTFFHPVTVVNPTHQHSQSHALSHQHSSDRFAPLPYEATTTTALLWVPSRRAGALIGREGAAVRALQVRARVSVRVHNDIIRDGHKLVTIMGSPRNVHTAARIISQTLARS